MSAATKPTCAIWVDYAVARTGSRSTQQIMASLAQHELVWHRHALILGGAIGHRHSAASFTKLLHAAAAANKQPCAGRLPLRAAVQVSDEDAADFWSYWLPAIRRLRAGGEQSCSCRVLLTTRVREPLSHYISTYTWAAAGKYNIGKSTAKPRTRVDASGNTYATLPQASFVSWAPRNLQVRVRTEHCVAQHACTLAL